MQLPFVLLSFMYSFLSVFNLVGRHLTHEMKVGLIHQYYNSTNRYLRSRFLLVFLMECIQIDQELARLDEIQTLFNNYRKVSKTEVFADQRLITYSIVKDISVDEFKRHILYYISLDDFHGANSMRHFFFICLKKFIQLTNQNLSVSGVIEGIMAYIAENEQRKPFILASWLELLIHLLHNPYFTFSDNDYKIVGQQIVWLLDTINEDVFFCICIQLLESILW